MSADAAAEALLAEHNEAIKIAVWKFRGLYGQYMSTDEAWQFGRLRMLVYAGILPSDHPRADSHAGKLSAWQARMAASDRPGAPVRASESRRFRGWLVKILYREMIDSVKTELYRQRYHPSVSLDAVIAADPNFDFADLTGF